MAGPQNHGHQRMDNDTKITYKWMMMEDEMEDKMEDEMEVDST